MLDIGSGGGFPGIPLKVVKSSLSVFLIDGTRKKVNFLKHMIRLLDLDHSEALHIRAENFAHYTEFATSFDVIISRALSDLSLFVKNALTLLANKGTIIAMKGTIDSKDADHLHRDRHIDAGTIADHAGATV